LIWALVPFILSCNGASGLKDVIDASINVPRKDIDTSILGVNAFASDARFGSPATQLNEVKNTLKLKYVRLLFAWTDAVQASPSASPNFSFYDQLAASIPSGVDALVVLTGLPSWMSDEANWAGGNPRTTFVDSWVKKVAKRYGGNGRIVGFQIFNEPNMTANPENGVLGIDSSPENYVEMLGRAFSAIRDVAPGKLVVNAATTAINQNYPDSLDYNRALRDSGAEQFLDRWAIHYYGSQYENVVRGSGVADVLNSLGKPIWVTESGAQGIGQQLEYGERTWPFLKEEIPGIQRIYQYQFAEPTDPTVTYGLKNLSSTPASDLYVFLRDR
jgi:hypothetical protein